jgi:large subunit ribosomal protein L10
MATTKLKKAEILTKLKDQFGRAKSVTFATYSGLTVAEISVLRRQLRATGNELVVAKKTLMKLAAKENGLPEPTDAALEGVVAAFFAYEDELAAPQALHEFSKQSDKVALVGGILDGELLGKAKINQLATLPNKTGLMGQLVGLLASPMRGFAGVGYGVLAGFARVLAEVEKKKATEA